MQCELALATLKTYSFDDVRPVFVLHDIAAAERGLQPKLAELLWRWRDLQKRPRPIHRCGFTDVAVQMWHYRCGFTD